MDFDGAKKQHPDKERLIDRLEKDAKLAEITADLEEHHGVQILLEKLTANLSGCNYRLLYEENLTEIDRAKLFAQREVLLYVCAHFKDARETIDSIENQIIKLNQYDTGRSKTTPHGA